MHIRLENLSFAYKSLGSPSTPVLRNINLEITAGELVGIAGPSGSGKSTLMQHFTGLLKPDAGRVLIDGRDLWAPRISFSEIRRRIGLVFQFPETQLFEETVFDDVAFGLRNLQLSADDLSKRVQEALRRVGLDFDSFRGRSPIYLSEGEKRRAALAGVLVMNPETLVLDEPTAGLDRHGVLAVSQILRDYHAAGKTVAIISHQLDLIFSLVERVVLMKDGAIHFDDSARELLRQPHLLEAAGLALPRVFVILQQLQQHGVDDVKLSAMLKRFIKA